MSTLVTCSLPGAVTTHASTRRFGGSQFQTSQASCISFKREVSAKAVLRQPVVVAGGIISVAGGGQQVNGAKRRGRSRHQSVCSLAETPTSERPHHEGQCEQCGWAESIGCGCIQPG
uniref:Uncharacterized protein n=1 Tax=Oryza rufipogon TaxID=4529 RepID=A0A0E0NCY1_ORYRU